MAQIWSVIWSVVTRRLSLTLNSKHQGQANQNQPAQSAKKKAPGHRYEQYDHPSEPGHRTAEQYSWRRQNVTSVLTTLLTFLAVVFTGLAFYQTRRQADIAADALSDARAGSAQTIEALDAAKRSAEAASNQADIAQQILIASTRARLKLTGITGAYITRGAVIDVAWFNFQPTYKNFGPSPAENIMFSPSIFVIGAGPSPKKVCSEAKIMSRSQSTEIVFPQDHGGMDWVGIQIPIRNLERQAAEVHAIQPSAPIYLGVVGCLTYKSGSDEEIYVTGFAGSLHPIEIAHSRPEKYIPLYDTLTKGDHPTKIRMEVKTESAWAD